MEEAKEKTTAVKATEMAGEARKLTKSLWAKAHEAKESGKKIAWSMFSGATVKPILAAFDIVPVWPENYGPICAAKRVEQRFLDRAVADGLSFELCGYTKIALGYASLCQELGEIPAEAPQQGMPEPDMLITNSSICDPRYKFFQALGRYYKVPSYCLDILCIPGSSDNEHVKEYYIRYEMEELKSLIAFLEEETGKKLDRDRLREYVQLQHEVFKTLSEIHQLRKAVPCPMPTQDIFASVGIWMFFCCEQEGLDFYKKTLDEVKYRVENKIGSIPDEKYRLLWGFGLPSWHTMKLFNYFESLGAVFAIEIAYYHGEPYDVELDDPVEILARRTVERYSKNKPICTAYPYLDELLVARIRDYKIAGMVHHQSLSCHAYSIGQRYYTDKVGEHVKIPTLFIESDIIDPRTFDEAGTIAKINAFIDTLETYKRGREHEESGGAES